MHEQLREILSAKPFIPFTVVMSDGTHITVTHPDMAWLTKLFLYVTTDDGETVRHLYLLHVTQILRQEQAV